MHNGDGGEKMFYHSNFVFELWVQWIVAFVVFLASASKFRFISGTGMIHGSRLEKIGGSQWN